MNITITIDGELSEADKVILRALAGDAPAASPFAETLPKVEPEATTPVKAKAKPGPKPKAKSEPEPVAEKPAEPEPEAPAEEDTSEKDQVEKAVARAAELLQSGGVARVKEALEELGAARVSQLKPADVPAFLEKLA